MARTGNMIKVARTPKQKPRREEEEKKEEKKKRICIDEALRDLGTLLTLRERGAAKIDPRPQYDDDADNKIPQRTLEPEETELEDVPLVEGTEKTTKIGKTLSPTIKVELS